jgi:hypothetical protein
MALAGKSGLSRNCAEAAGLPPTSTLYSLRYWKSVVKQTNKHIAMEISNPTAFIGFLGVLYASA